MGFWFRARLGPVGYTFRPRRRRRPQSYRSYRAGRRRREAYAARYQREGFRGTWTSEDARAFAKALWIVILVVVLSPVLLLVYVILKLVRALTPSFAASLDERYKRARGSTEAVDEGAEVEAGDEPSPSTATRAPTEAELEALGQSLVRPPRTATAAGSRIKHVDPHFAGVALPTLRAWLRFWSNPDKVAAAIKRGDFKADAFDPKHEVKIISAEIAAREAAR